MLEMFEQKTRREFITDEWLVTTVLSAINGQSRGKVLRNITVANCGWADEPPKWFVSFYVGNTMYGKIVKALNEVGKFKLDVRPGGQVDVVFMKEA